jgi:hypothetical protein
MTDLAVLSTPYKLTLTLLALTSLESLIERPSQCGLGIADTCGVNHVAEFHTYLRGQYIGDEQATFKHMADSIVRMPEARSHSKIAHTIFEALEEALERQTSLLGYLDGSSTSIGLRGFFIECLMMKLFMRS